MDQNTAPNDPQESKVEDEAPVGTSPGLTAEEERKIADRLRDLGYIE